MNNKQVNFEDISPADKRVMIAKDVINKLKTKQFIASAQTWLSTFDDSRDLISGQDVKDARQLQSILRDFTKPDDPNCQACALGGCFIAAVDLFNDIRANDVTTEATEGLWIEKMSDYLGKFFEKDQLTLIEVAFEYGNGGFKIWDHSSVKEATCAAAMFWNVKDPSTRMISIMSNIIENKGQFVVPITDELITLFDEEVVFYDPDGDGEDEDDNYNDEDEE